MKITKKQPLRPRGRSEEKRQSTKNAIRDAYINGPQKEVQIIPAKRDVEAETEKKKLRVCAYCRVSTDANYHILCAVPLCHPKFLKGAEYIGLAEKLQKVQIP